MSAHVTRRFASRGGEKLDGALDSFRLDVRGLRALDAGAATGGFTDCLLQRGVHEVVAVDVAYGALDWKLRNDPRVNVMERTNIRSLDAASIGGPVELVVADLSFISLRTVAGSLVGACTDDAHLVLMVKPQFELPRADVPRGGVVREPAAWLTATVSVVETYRALGCGLAGAVASMLPGPKGNREFFLHLVRGAPDVGDAVLAAAIEAAP